MAARAMTVSTPVDGLLFLAMHAREELSRPFEYRLDLLSEHGNVDMDEILGKVVTVNLELPEGETRYFSGHVTRFAQSGTAGRYNRYSAVVRPWLWFLTRTADCRIFQEKTVPKVLELVFADHPAADFKLELTGKYRERNYCVQYRESDFNFVSRLMEEEGIYYYFRHTDGHNTMVLTDSTSTHSAASGCKALPFMERVQAGKFEVDRISEWDFAREIQPGVYVHDDYDLERPKLELKTKKVLPRTYKPSDYEVFDYPGFYLQTADGVHYADVRINEYGTQFESANGATNARNFSVGSLVSLEDHPRKDQNREHLVIAGSYDLTDSDYESLPQRASAEYHCRFTAMSSKQQFRPRRLTPKPFVQGPQTAVVVGPGGEEIHTDKYGRVKVQFHWDRLGKKDENSSCWIRVSHPWAGKAWGGISLPRIGQEVIVDFLEGDPDQPIVTGRVYNAEQMPPYELPANKTQSGMKSRSSKDAGPDNFNEIRFEDKKGSEQLFIHAEKNQDIEVENDETHSVGHDRTKTIGHDETTQVKHDRTETVDNNETITIHANRTETVDKDESITISGNRTENVAKDETIAIGKNRTETVADNETVDIGKDQIVSVKANRTLNVGKDESITVSANRTDQVEKNEGITIGKKRETSIGDDDSLKVGKKLLVDAGDQITIQTGSASITMKSDGTITIKGKDITLEGSGKVNVKASSDVVIKGSKIGQN